MGDVISLDNKRKPEVDVIGIIKKQLDEITDDITGGMVVLINKDREVISGFFNTSFQDEAVMSKVLEYDIQMRHQAGLTQEDI